MKYDQLVIGNGRDAVSAAINGAVQGRHLALVNVRDASPDRFTCDVFRQAVERLIKVGSVSMTALRSEVAAVVESNRATDQAELARLGVDVFRGDVRFVNVNTITVGAEHLAADSIVLACGTKSAALGQAPFDCRVVLAAEELLSLEELPRSMIVIGAGRTGLEHAIVLALLGVEVTVVDEHLHLFDLCGGLMGITLLEAQSLDVVMRLGDEVIGIEKRLYRPHAAVRLASGRVLTADASLVCIGREGLTEGLNLESVGVGLDERGRIWCDGDGRTWTRNITAVGDVVGFRAALWSTPA